MEEKDFTFLIEGLSIDTTGHWTQWDWKQVGPMRSYDFARLEEYRDSVIVAYRLYNRIGLEHLRRLLAQSPHHIQILDAGGGTGRKAIPLAQGGFKHITLLDIAPGWLRLANEKAQAAKVCERLTLTEGDVLDMCNLPDNSFDFVCAMGGVLSYCGDLQRAVREMTRVLKPGGEFFADGIHSRLGSMHLLAQMGQLDALEALTNSTPTTPNTTTITDQSLVIWAKRAGLIDVHVWSEFMFTPDDDIRIGPDTQRWERVVLDLEVRHYQDPRFLSAAMLMLYGTKK